MKHFIDIGGAFLAVLFLATSLAAAQHPGHVCTGPRVLEERAASHPSAAAYDALGAYFGQLDNYACAIPAFRSSLRLDPKSWRTHSYLGLALLANGDAEHAAKELEVSLRLNPDQSEAHMTLGAALVQINQPDAAIEQFNLVLKKDPASVTALDWMAKTFITQQRYSSAIALLKTSPADEVLQMDLVIAYSKSGRNDESIRILSQMIKDRPASAVAHSGLATIYTQQNRLEDAIAEFKEALRLGPHNDEIQVSYAKTLILLSDFEAALPVVQEYQRNHPREFQACYLMGVVDRELGKNAEARDKLKEAVRLDPNHFDARYNLGIVLVDLKEPVEARTQFERALQLDPSSNETRFRLANLLRSMGLREEAGRQFEIYQRNSKERAKRDVAVNKANQADQALAKGEIHQAVELYRQAVEEDPQNVHMFYNLALALDRAGDVSGEAEALHRAAEIDPGFALAHNQLGFLAFQSGEIAAAEKQYQLAISLNPHYAEAENNLGSIYGQQGKDQEAERLLRHAIEDNPDYVEAYVNLAVTLASQSRFEEAQSALSDATRLDPQNERVQAVRAQMAARLNQQGKIEK